MNDLIIPLSAEPKSHTFPLISAETKFRGLVRKVGKTHYLSGQGKEFVQFQGEEIPSNQFPLAALLAFSYHQPIRLTPEIIWMQILQGVSLHVNFHPEKYRNKLVSHKGRMVLRIDILHFPRSADWERLIPKFADMTSDNLKPEWGNLLVPQFSETSHVERMAFSIGAMDTLKSFFEYEVFVLCGIPAIHLGGTAEDWQRIIDALDQLDQLDLNWWTQHLRPHLQEFIIAKKGEINQDFWERFFSEPSEEGPWARSFTGWICDFFPYLKTEDYPGQLLAELKETGEEIFGLTKFTLPPRSSSSRPISDRILSFWWKHFTKRGRDYNRLEKEAGGPVSFWTKNGTLGSAERKLAFNQFGSGLSEVEIKITLAGATNKSQMVMARSGFFGIQHHPNGLIEPYIGAAVTEK